MKEKVAAATQKLTKPLKVLYAKLRPYLARLSNQQFDTKVTLTSALAAVTLFLIVFSVLSLFVAKKPYPEFANVSLSMPKLATPADLAKAKGLASVVIRGVGLNKALQDALAQENMPLFSIALSPYTNNPSAVVADLQHFGYEAWLDTAFTARSAGVDAGPMSLTPAQNTADNAEVMWRQLAPMNDLIRGILVSPDAALPFVGEIWNPLAKLILQRQIFILDATSAAVAPAVYMTGSSGAFSSYIKADVLLDGMNGIDAVTAALSQLQANVTKNKRGILIVSNANPLTIHLLQQGLADLEKKFGTETVPVSTLMSSYRSK